MSAPTDRQRLDWLALKVVNVRDPLPYGSRDLLWASPEDVEGGPDMPSSLRTQIDLAMANEARKLKGRKP